LAKSFGNGELAHIETLAKAEEVPANYLAQILNELRNGGLVISRRGKLGGYALARGPDAITLYDIICAIDGEMLEHQLSTRGQSGERVAGVWREVLEALRDKTRGYTLESFMRRDADDMYYI
jgi:Rrf2 family protein